jgi:hypothetical protein
MGELGWRSQGPRAPTLRKSARRSRSGRMARIRGPRRQGGTSYLDQLPLITRIVRTIRDISIATANGTREEWKRSRNPAGRAESGRRAGCWSQAVAQSRAFSQPEPRWAAGARWYRLPILAVRLTLSAVASRLRGLGGKHHGVRWQRGPGARRAPVGRQRDPVRTASGSGGSGEGCWMVCMLTLLMELDRWPAPGHITAAAFGRRRLPDQLGCQLTQAERWLVFYRVTM